MAKTYPPDPQFPDRPDHPDFWAMSQAARDGDDEAEGGTELPDIIAQFADTPSVLYLARHRAIRLTGLGAGPLQPRLEAAWIDGILIGLRLAATRAIPDADAEGEGLT